MVITFFSGCSSRSLSCFQSLQGLTWKQSCHFLSTIQFPKATVHTPEKEYKAFLSLTPVDLISFIFCHSPPPPLSQFTFCSSKTKLLCPGHAASFRSPYLYKMVSPIWKVLILLSAWWVPIPPSGPASFHHEVFQDSCQQRNTLPPSHS